MFRIRFIIVSIVLFVSTISWAELPSATSIAPKLKLGWNMGNALECPIGETGWGSAYTTQALIDSVKAAGFSTVRLPVAWFSHSDTLTSVIDPIWMARVKTIVDYCIKDSLYVILNCHWDKGWLENRITKAHQATVNKRQRVYWTQIATAFKGYDEHLLFAGANEPNASDSVEMDILMSYYQTFVDAVRATGGNNTTRTLVVQGPSTDIEKTDRLMNTLPKDPAKNRLMVEVHYYTPYQFCLMEKDTDWGRRFYYWGQENHSKTDSLRNADWGEEADVEKFFNRMKVKFVHRNIPVILGEFAAFQRHLSEPSDQNLHNASIEAYYTQVVKSALENGITPICWDINNGIFDRASGKVVNSLFVRGMIKGKSMAGCR